MEEKYIKDYDTSQIQIEFNVDGDGIQLKTKKINSKHKIYLLQKRLFDLFIASLALVILSPLFILLPFLYTYGDLKGSPFFKQLRIGKNGKLFYMYKFRSMVVDADQRLKQDEELYKLYIKNNYKLEPKDDPRITKVGAFLRKTSLDELPQLINVLKGDMSLVGPRPILKEELTQYGLRESEFISVKPGITGCWAANGRSNVQYPERIDLELEYLTNQSFLFDLSIIFKTVYGLFKSKGAY